MLSNKFGTSARQTGRPRFSTVSVEVLHAVAVVALGRLCPGSRPVGARTGAGAGHRLRLSNPALQAVLDWTDTGVRIDSAWPDFPGTVHLDTVAVGRDTLEPTTPGPVAPIGCSGLGDDAWGRCLQQVGRSLGPGVEEWWINRLGGVEQGWTFDSVVGDGPLRIVLEIDGATARVESPTAPVLEGAFGQFRYDGLRRGGCDVQPPPEHTGTRSTCP